MGQHSTVIQSSFCCSSILERLGSFGLGHSINGGGNENRYFNARYIFYTYATILRSTTTASTSIPINLEYRSLPHTLCICVESRRDR